MKHQISLWVGISLFLFSACTATKQVMQNKKPIYLKGVPSLVELEQMEEKRDRFYLQLLGHFSNRDYLKANPDSKVPPQDGISIQIFKDRIDEFWTYSEIFLSHYVEEPVVQRIERFTRVNRDTFILDAFVLKNPKDYTNEWKKANPFKNLSHNDLIPAEGCSLYLTNTEEPNVYQSVPMGKDKITCFMPPVNIAGSIVKYVYLEMTYSASKINAVRDLYDGDKKIVIKTPPGGVDFFRLDPSAEGYIDLSKMPVSNE